MTTTLPIAPQDFYALVAALTLIVLTLVVYAALITMQSTYRAPIWEELSPGWLAIALILALLWIGLFALTLWAAFCGVWEMTHPDQGSGAGDSTSGLGMGALLAALLGAPFVIWGTVLKHRTVTFQKEGHLTDRISKAVEQLGAEKTVKVELRGEDDKPQVAERTVPNIEVRIGGILSLERIAQDSTNYDKGRDHVRAMEILCAYVRENAPASRAERCPLPDWEPLKDDATEQEREEHVRRREVRFGQRYTESIAYQWAQSLKEPRTAPRADIAIALAVIGRRNADQRRVEARWGKDASPDAEWVFDTACPALPDRPGDTAMTPGAVEAYCKVVAAWQEKIGAYRGYRPDLRGTNLQAAGLSDAILSGARLQGTRLEGAILGQARLEGADLSQARLEGADLEQAQLQGATLLEARLEGADLSEARLEGANLSVARLEGARLWYAQLTGAFLGWARLEGADLPRARLEGANLEQARLEGASLWEARLESAVLSEARLDGADLRKARLDLADLSSAWMTNDTNLKSTALQGASARKVNWSMADISDAQIASMFGDGSVRLPGGVAPGHRDWPAHWPTWELGRSKFNVEWRKWQADPNTYVPPPPPSLTSRPTPRPPPPDASRLRAGPASAK